MHHDQTPTSEFEIDAALVHKLLADQHPDLAHLSILPPDAGWDNVMFRLGDHLCVRLPRRQMAAPPIEHEQTWLPRLASQLSIAVPTPLRLGMPSHRYPWRWSILPWSPGQTAEQTTLDTTQAQRFGAFLKALHQPAPANAPHNPVRGVPLLHRARAIDARMQRLVAKTDCMTDNLRDALPIVAALLLCCFAVDCASLETFFSRDAQFAEGATDINYPKVTQRHAYYP